MPTITMTAVHHLDHSLHFFNGVDVWAELPGTLRFRPRKRVFGRIASRYSETEECIEHPELVEPLGGHRAMSVEEISNHFRRDFVELDWVNEPRKGVQLERTALIAHAQRLLVDDVFSDGVSDFHATLPRPIRATSLRAAISPTL